MPGPRKRRLLQRLDSKITQWRLWYFRAFKMQSMPRLTPAAEEARKAAEQWREQMMQEQSKVFERRKRLQERLDGNDVVPMSWLKDRLTLRQILADNISSEGDRLFGRQNDEWEDLRRSLREDDEIWSFCSPPESWKESAGLAGMAVVRQGRVVDCLVTKTD